MQQVVAGKHRSGTQAFFGTDLHAADPALAGAIGREIARQRHEIELITSENIVSRAVLQAAGSALTNKYAEGYPGKRYYGGRPFVHEAGARCLPRAKRPFHRALCKDAPS